MKSEINCWRQQLIIDWITEFKFGIKAWIGGMISSFLKLISAQLNRISLGIKSECIHCAKTFCILNLMTEFGLMAEIISFVFIGSILIKNYCYNIPEIKNF